MEDLEIEMSNREFSVPGDADALLSDQNEVEPTEEEELTVLQCGEG